MEFTTTWQDPKQYITGSTSFGTYQSQNKYKEDAIKVARFTARKLGYPIVNIEFISIYPSNQGLKHGYNNIKSRRKVKFISIYPSNQGLKREQLMRTIRLH